LFLSQAQMNDPVLPSSGKLLGLDLGTKTIGVAVSDGLRMTATALETIGRTKFTADAARLAELVVAASERGEASPDVDLEMAGFNLFSLYMTTLIAWLSGALGPGESWRKVLERALALQIRGLGPGAETPPRSGRRRT